METQPAKKSFWISQTRIHYTGAKTWLLVSTAATEETRVRIGGAAVLAINDRDVQGVGGDGNWRAEIGSPGSERSWDGVK